MRITTVGGKVFEGEIYCVDPVSHAIALKENSNSNVFTIIASENIVSISGINILTDIPTPTVEGVSITTEDIRIQEEMALRNSEKLLEAINFRVSGEIQALYDRISLIYGNTCWKGMNIEVLEEYVIAPPYDSVAVMPGKDGAGLERINKVVSKHYVYYIFTIF